MCICSKELQELSVYPQGNAPGRLGSRPPSSRATMENALECVIHSGARWERSGTQAAPATALVWSMYAGTHFTDFGRVESWVNLEEGHTNIEPTMEFSGWEAELPPLSEWSHNIVNFKTFTCSRKGVFSEASLCGQILCKNRWKHSHTRLWLFPSVGCGLTLHWKLCIVRYLSSQPPVARIFRSCRSFTEAIPGFFRSICLLLVRTSCKNKWMSR